MTGKIQTTAVIAILAVAVLVGGCSDDSATLQSPADVQGDLLSIDELKVALNKFPVGDPSEAETADLLFMREEEKLAHDVYTVLYDQYDMKIFFNISNSEQKHTEAILMLLDRFGIEDIAEGNGPGEFTNEDLQKLYGDLVDSGSQSVADALLAGLQIEELDILDLIEAMDTAQLPEILMVYHNLLMGSHNHLRAFATVYEKQTGEVYEPRWLSQEAYDEILGKEPGHGRRGRP